MSRGDKGQARMPELKTKEQKRLKESYFRRMNCDTPTPEELGIMLALEEEQKWEEVLLPTWKHAYGALPAVREHLEWIRGKQQWGFWGQQERRQDRGRSRTVA